jgi:hypothetical protein
MILDHLAFDVHFLGELGAGIERDDLAAKADVLEFFIMAQPFNPSEGLNASH